MLLIMLLAIPLMGIFFLFFIRNKSINIPLISSIIILIGSFRLKGVLQGEVLKYNIPLSGPFILKFSADGLSFIFIILAIFLWFVVSIYSPKYMEYEGKSWIFQLCTLFILFAVMGIFLAGDLLTMLLFFELMTISSYFWVIHRWDGEAIRAGYFYLFFSIVGGLLIALGIVMMGEAVDTLPLIGEGAAIPLNPKLFAWSIAALVAGFGIKAGMVPLHLWLPYAHSVAPTPGSALLSGLLIKVGAYGLIRTGEFVGWGIGLWTEVAWLGPILIILGTCTMLLGVISALIQSNGKKLLAYHSISQMGYIILGLGVGLYLGADGGFGLSGAIYHIINHALFKAALFLGVGIIYIHTGETNLYELGGLWRRFPITAILMLLAVLGITGAPGLNGYASKSLLHHGISLAAEIEAPWLIWIERLFLIVGVGTAASFSKLYYLIFFGKPTKLKIKDKGSYKLQLAIGLLAIVMLGIGIRPKFLLNIAIIPAVYKLGMKDISTILMGFSFWNIKDIVDMIITLILGILVCWAGLKTGVFHWHFPTCLTIEGAIKLINRKILKVLQWMLKLHRLMAGIVQNTIEFIGFRLSSGFRKFDQSKGGTLYGVNLAGISADIAILIMTLGLLIGLYIIAGPGLIVLN